VRRRLASLLVLVAAALAFLAPGAVAAIVVSTARAMRSLESSFDAAVVAGTVFPFTGELDGQCLSSAVTSDDESLFLPPEERQPLADRPREMLPPVG
jgi:hypothetical protein